MCQEDIKYLFCWLYVYISHNIKTNKSRVIGLGLCAADHTNVITLSTQQVRLGGVDAISRLPSVFCWSNMASPPCPSFRGRAGLNGTEPSSSWTPQAADKRREDKALGSNQSW